MDEEEDEGWSREPKVGVADLHQRDALDHGMTLRDVDRHPADDALKLRPHRQDDLHVVVSVLFIYMHAIYT